MFSLSDWLYSELETLPKDLPCRWFLVPSAWTWWKLEGVIWSFEIVKILSHENAQIESGFSVNLDLPVENLPKESLVAQCQVYDGIRTVGIENVEITQLILQNVL